jgi:hypothetical protein
MSCDDHINRAAAIIRNVPSVIKGPNCPFTGAAAIAIVIAPN